VVAFARRVERGAMTIPAGTRLGAFEVSSLLGVGGMGEVYRARDTKLRREVALKLLPEFLARDEEKLKHLEREAHLLASLNHPNIATLHGLEESEGLRFLVMELVPGETLAERLARGRISIEESLSIMRQMGEALEAAHDKGIIHRDLKPANVKVTSDGKVKLLDFGLAKAIAEEKSPADLSRSPTLTREGTEHGVILGTASYMSPEQARGQALDRKTDIWSFGCVLYEVFTGRKAFPGETVSDIIASILARDPDWDALPERTPLKIRDLLRRCLQREPHRRLRDIGDARIEIEESLAEPATVPVASRPRRVLPLVMVATALVAVAVWGLLHFGRAAPRVVSRFDLSLPPEEALTHLNDPVVTWSPDGTRLVYVGGRPRKLYVRAIDQMESTAIPGTENATTAFFSPDGEWVGFYGAGRLKKVQLATGSAITLCDVLDAWGASWGDDDTILFAPTPTSGLFRISASGGAASAVTTPDPSQGEISHRWPEFLPGGEAALFTIWTGSSETSRIAVLSLETGQHPVVIEGASFARYSSTGHLLYAREGQLVAAPFDLERLEVTGLPVPLSVEVRTVGGFGTAHFSLSREGSLAYLPPSGPPEKTLLWVDRNGWTRPLTETRRAYRDPRLSPDGKRLAVTIFDDRAYIWVYDLERDALTRLSGADGYVPIWTPDGQRITYDSATGPAIIWQAVDGSSTPEKVTSTTAVNSAPSSWSPDGKWLAFNDALPKTRQDIWLLSLEGDRPARPLLQTPASEAGGVFSPDGRWIAYDSDESGRREAYVQPFPGPGAKWQVSTEGGSQVVWARNGREIFYRSDDKMMAVEVETEPSFRLSKAKLLFEGRYEYAAEWFGSTNYDVTPDGQRFLMIRSEEQPAPTRIRVVLNWAEELKAKVPSGGR
jgi:serine/threonine-protein kinase